MSGNYYYLFFAGYYATERAADVLQQYGISARVVKSPVILQSGCSFAVLLDPADGAVSYTHLDVYKRQTSAYIVFHNFIQNNNFQK